MDERQHLSLRRLPEHRRGDPRHGEGGLRMQAFSLLNPTTATDAVAAAQAHQQAAKYLAGGTDLMQLMKDNVERPTRLVDLEGVGLSHIHADASGLRIEAMARMSDVAQHPAV